jgi:endonuclease YncB( thermonuclease family)
MPRLSAFLTSLALLAGCAESMSSELEPPLSTTEVTTTTTQRQTDPDPDPAPSTAGGASVIDVVDGDTITLDLAGGQETVRLVGINAPERGECLAEEAGRRLQDLVAGQEVELIQDRSERDRYGRLLRYVEVDGVDVGAELVRAGLALARRYPPDTGRAEEYESLQQQAADEDVGMWAPDACGDAAAVGQVEISEIRFDADGDDNENLDDEWVRITNAGSTRVELGGWVLKDTSASHRYRFPSGFVLDAGASVTVRTGCGTDTATDLHWCNEGSAVWNNSGDTAFLLDPSGNIVSSQDG